MSMRKRDEIESPDSCLNKAGEDEFIFVLLGCDKAAPETIRLWIAERLRLGLNNEHDAQIKHADWLAKYLAEWHVADAKK